jgi:hypothetical protein
MSDNPYQFAMRAADTMNLIMEKRLQFRQVQDGTVSPHNRRWRTVGGHVGWHESLLHYASLFLTAGLIDHTKELRRDDWAQVYPTDAGLYLMKLWRSDAFEVVPLSELPDRLRAANTALAVAYVEGSGLLEDDPARYEPGLRKHTEAAGEALLDVPSLGKVQW